MALSISMSVSDMHDLVIHLFPTPNNDGCPLPTRLYICTNMAITIIYQGFRKSKWWGF